LRYLLDTNVLSELSKRSPDKAVLTWFERKDGDDLYLCSITIGEIAYGIERLADGRRKQELNDWFKDVLINWFAGRIVSLDADVMRCWAQIKASNRTLPVMGSLIAAAAITSGSVLVTRNSKDFAGIDGLEVVDPLPMS
jgi:predicted nucleic acid-binding protein